MNICKSLGIFLLFILISFLTSCSNEIRTDITKNNLSENNLIMENNTNSLVDTSQLTFKVKENVNIQKVTFKNKYGIELVGNLYTPKDTPTEKLQAIAISGPFGAVKEQSSGLYANELASRGFVTLAFDPSYTGESSGVPRNMTSPELGTEDFSAAVDYLGTLESVDREKIGILGICGFGGFALNTASTDKRIKAVATSTMYDMSRVLSNGYNDVNTDEVRKTMLNNFANARWASLDGTLPSEDNSGLLTEQQLSAITDPVRQMYMRYYKTTRGFNERSINSNQSWNVNSMTSFINFPLMTRIKYISPNPILIVAGENAHSRYFSEDAYKNASEPKELVIVPGANHTDLYDGGENNYIPFDKYEDFFKTNLK